MSLKLLAIGDPRWNEYRGGYKTVVENLLSFLTKVASGQIAEQDWEILWDELHHQGDVGEASYAVVPYLAEYGRSATTIPYHVFLFPAVVELARTENRNPEVPEEIRFSYDAAIRELPKIALSRGDKTWDAYCFEPVMACLALSLGRRIHAQAYLDLTEQEIPEFYKYYYGE